MQEEIYGEMDRRKATAKQSQFAHGPAGRPIAGVTVQNEPNFQRGEPLGPTDLCETNPICQGLSCQTKPIPPQASHEASTAREKSYGELESQRLRRNKANLCSYGNERGLRAIMRNEANSSAARRDGAGATRAGVFVQTNPICYRRIGKTIPKATGLEAATRAGRKSAKQSQFRPERCGGEFEASGHRRGPV